MHIEQSVVLFILLCVISLFICLHEHVSLIVFVFACFGLLYTHAL